jgi:DUF1365 family protein
MVLRMLFDHPFMTQRTIALIHVHAWRLWRRGVRFQRHGEAVAAHAASRTEGGGSPVQSAQAQVAA